ncbi:MAG: hypothetical protein FWF38_07395 [Spirochaetaceae bacterium]|nr:hypothetical protein [Spirochaetaceae bacterium]
MLRYINNIISQPDHKTIFSRLGYKQKQTELDEAAKKEIISWIGEAASLIKLRGSILECNLEIADEGKILIYPENNSAKKIEITSNYFYKFILEAKKFFLMGITCGKEIMDFIEKEQQENMTKAVVLDAAAGEIADSGLDYIVSFYNKELIRKSEKLFTKRFSPGYGDLSLETQKVFYDLLEMKKIGVDITESFMLIPQKSIIALTRII